MYSRKFMYTVFPVMSIALLLMAAVANKKVEKVPPLPKPIVKQKPAFEKVRTIDERKRLFFQYLKPIIRAENGRILQERSRLKALYDRYLRGGPFSQVERSWLHALAQRYRMNAVLSREESWGELKKRVDIIPEELALTQAAVESNWGTSRFAREGNNLFGEWCHKVCCGIIPSERPKDMEHEVKKFDSVNSSVSSYMRNLNTHPVYNGFRESRRKLREAGKPLDGLVLAAGLLRYSSKHEKYVKLVRDMIVTNKPLIELD